jgi:hypothetical protein
MGQTAEEVLEQVKSSSHALEDAVIRATWEELVDGKLTAWEDQAIFWDNLGRMRLTYEWGRYDSEGNRVVSAEQAKVSDTLYDGELVVHQESFPNRDRLGKILKEPARAAGYRAAIVADGKAPLRRDLEAHRNPLTYLVDSTVRDLEAAVAAGRPLTLQTVESGKKSFAVGFNEPPDTQYPFCRSVVYIDGERDWSITKLESFDENDHLVRAIEFEYNRQENDFWVPARGSHKHWGKRSQETAPAWEWRFTAKQCSINDPAFDENVFAAVLAPDTAVADTRFQVNYRIGSEKATVEDLARFAERARAQPVEAPELGRKPLQYFLLGSFLLAAVILGLRWWARRTRSVST